MTLILFLLLPVLEIYLFVKAFQAYGFWVLLIEVLFTAWLGFTILRFRSLIMIGALNKTLKKKSSPEKEMLKGLLIFLGALLLIVPGLLTDVLGLLCLFGPTRGLIGLLMSRNLKRMAKDGRFRMVYNSTPFGRDPSSNIYDFDDIGGEIRDVGPGTEVEVVTETVFLESERRPSPTDREE